MFAQTTYKIPLASQGNRIELAVRNASAAAVSGVTVAVRALPRWVQVKEPVRKVPPIQPNHEQSVTFEFSIAADAPVGKGQPLDFDVIAPDGEKWAKQIIISVAPPDRFTLFENFPNPFNPTSVIRYALPTDARVTLKVYNVLGQEVETLVDGVQSAGFKQATFDASNLPSGVYFYRLQAGNSSAVKKMLLAK